MTPHLLAYHPGRHGPQLGAPAPDMPAGYEQLVARVRTRFAWPGSTPRTLDPAAFARTAALLEAAAAHLDVRPAAPVHLPDTPEIRLFDPAGRPLWPDRVLSEAAHRVAGLDDLRTLRRPGRDPEAVAAVYSPFRCVSVDGRVLAGAGRIRRRTPLHTHPTTGPLDAVFEDRPGDGDPRPDPGLAARYARAAAIIHDKLTRRVPEASVLRIDLALDADGEVVLEDAGPVVFQDLYGTPPGAVLDALFAAIRAAPENTTRTASK